MTTCLGAQSTEKSLRSACRKKANKSRSSEILARAFRRTSANRPQLEASTIPVAMPTSRYLSHVPIRITSGLPTDREILAAKMTAMETMPTFKPLDNKFMFTVLSFRNRVQAEQAWHLGSNSNGERFRATPPFPRANRSRERELASRRNMTSTRSSSIDLKRAACRRYSTASILPRGMQPSALNAIHYDMD